MEHAQDLNPIVWAGVVSVVAIDGVRRVLTLKEIDKDFMLIPGGKVEKGESDHEAIIRELHEELGSSVAVERLSDSPDVVFTAPSKKTGQIIEFRIYIGIIQNVDASSLPDRTESIAYLASNYSAEGYQVGNLSLQLMPWLIERGLID